MPKDAHEMTKAELHKRVVTLGFDSDESVMVLDDGIGSGQTEAVALCFGGKVGIKDTFEILFGNADAFVADFNADVISDCGLD